jgi:hypothetical protein
VWDESNYSLILNSNKSKLIVMKKLAVLLTFVFAVALVAPAFAADPVKKEATKTECTKDAKGNCSKDCKKACCNKDAKAADAKTAKPEAKK